MESVIANLPATVSPEAVQQGAPEELKTGHVSIAADIFKTFAEDSDDTKVKAIARWADAKTCEEFRKECKAAQEIADNVDKASGFVPKPDAKGAEKYGPKRKVFNSRLAEAKVLFGVFKLSPESLKEKGYWNAVQAARDVLKAKNLKWDGEPIPSDARKAELKMNAEFDAAEKACRDENPQQAGESYKEYKDRIAPMVDEYRNEALAKDALVKFQKLTKELPKDVARECLMLAVLAGGPEFALEFSSELFDRANAK